MTPTVATEKLSLHKCPACGTQCAASSSEMEQALRAQKDIRIACHNCNENFAPTPIQSTSPSKASDDLDYTKRDGKAVGRRASVIGRIAGLFKRVKKDKKATIAPPTKKSGTDKDKDKGKTRINRIQLFGKSDAKSGEKPAEKLSANTDTKAESKPSKKPSFKRPSPVALASMIGLSLVILTGALFILAPNKLVQTLEIFSVRQVQPASFSITNAVYERIETNVGKSVVITINLENTGASSGTPRTIMVELLDQSRQPILSWPVATNALIIEPGQSRTLVTRIFEPPTGFNDIQVTLAND